MQHVSPVNFMCFPNLIDAKSLSILDATHSGATEIKDKWIKGDLSLCSLVSLVHDVRLSSPLLFLFCNCIRNNSRSSSISI